MDEQKENELKRLFGNRLTFGTAGIRGSMGPGYAQMNDLVIIQTSQGLAKYIIQCQGEKLCKERGVIMGHDARHDSARFSRLAALAFLQLGIPVYYCDCIIPTPLVAFGVSLFNCLCGIVITASHNPKQDNGYKVYWANGAQILSPHDKNIQRHIERAENQQPWPLAWNHECLKHAPSAHTAFTAFTAPSESSSLSSVDSRQSVVEQQHHEPLPREFEGLVYRIHGELSKIYFAYIQQLVGERASINQSSSIRITYTTMHGVGHDYLSRALGIAGFKEAFPVEAQRRPDPEFPSVKFPNPEEAGALDLAFETAARTNSNLILANDPDADRCAAALYDPDTRNRRILTGNEIGALLGWWIWHCYQARKASADTASLANHESSSSDDRASTSSGQASVPRAPTSVPLAPGQLKKPEDCYMLSTAVSSRFLRSMAQVEGFRFVETLTGFKHMGNVAHDLIHKQNKRVLFAYEEAIGYMVDSRILDKDGISAAVQLAQCAAYLKHEHKRTLETQLAWLHTRYGYHYSLNSYYICHEPRTITAIFHKLQSDYPKCFTSSNQSEDQPEEKFVVTRIRDLNNGIDNGSPDHRATLPTSSSSYMVTFFIDTQIQFTIRTSGTEPKIKYYSEIVSSLPKSPREGQGQSLSEAQQEAKLEAQARLERFVRAAVERCLQPAYYQLEPAAGAE